MSAQDQLRRKVLDALDGDETRTDAVMKIFYRVHGEVDEIETTARGDTHHQIQWVRWAIARCVLESGNYQGAARTEF